MTYRQTKLTVMLVWVLVGFVFLGVGWIGDKPVPVEMVIFMIIISIFASVIMGALTWAIVRIGYVENMLNKSTLSEKDIRSICSMVDMYDVNKTMTDYDIVLITNSLVSSVRGFTHCDKDDLYHTCMAAVLLHYSTLWKRKVQCKDRCLSKRLDLYHDRMKMVYHFAHTYF